MSVLNQLTLGRKPISWFLLISSTFGLLSILSPSNHLAQSEPTLLPKGQVQLENLPWASTWHPSSLSCPNLFDKSFTLGCRLAANISLKFSESISDHQCQPAWRQHLGIYLCCKALLGCLNAALSSLKPWCIPPSKHQPEVFEWIKQRHWWERGERWEVGGQRRNHLGRGFDTTC